MIVFADVSKRFAADGWAVRHVNLSIQTGELDDVRKTAAVKVHKTLRMGRHAGVSMEGRGVLAHYDRRLDELVVYSSTQFPHVIRTFANSSTIANSFATSIITMNRKRYTTAYGTSPRSSSSIPTV